MKKLLLLLLLISSMSISFAQESGASNDHIIYIDVPQTMKLKDKIILQNKSPFSILKAVVVLVNDGTTIGTASYLNPNCTTEMAEYEDNWLKNLRGKRIGIKVKGVKTVLSDRDYVDFSGGTSVSDPQEEKVSVSNIKNVDASLITYDFSAKISEEDHDLYIIVTAKSTQGAFDF